MHEIVGPSAGFWRGRRVLVTGHTGFKGSWLCLWLRHLGAEVTGLALAPETEPSLFEEAGVASIVDHIEGDIREAGVAERALKASGAEIVLHMAAQALVRPSYDDPVGTFETNVVGTARVLEAVRRIGGVRSVVSVTSDKCYENREWAWAYREDEPMGGKDPYSASKGCAELVTASFRRSFFEKGDTAVATARAGNVIGGGDWAKDRLVPDCVRCLGAGRAIPIRSPRATRPWQHVLEPLSGYLVLAEALAERGQDAAEGWNFGPVDDDAQPVRWMVDRVCAAWGDGARWEQDGAEHPAEATYLKVDASKARQKLGWRPRMRVWDAVDWAVGWHRAHLEGADASSLCLEQIDKYERLAGADEAPSRAAVGSV